MVAVVAAAIIGGGGGGGSGYNSRGGNSNNGKSSNNSHSIIARNWVMILASVAIEILPVAIAMKVSNSGNNDSPRSNSACSGGSSTSSTAPQRTPE